MRVSLLDAEKHVYSSNSYLIRGDWNAIGDINTLIDVGADDSIVAAIEAMSTGFGKIPVARVILTHGHSDHTAALAEIKKRYHPRVYAHTPFAGVDEELADGRILRVGDSDCEVIHAPGHSNDSICLYFARERVLFSGDTPLVIRTPGGSYDSAFIGVLERLAALPIDVIYSGHDEPVFRDVASLITETIKNVRKSRSK